MPPEPCRLRPLQPLQPQGWRRAALSLALPAFVFSLEAGWSLAAEDPLGSLLGSRD